MQNNRAFSWPLNLSRLLSPHSIVSLLALLHYVEALVDLVHSTTTLVAFVHFVGALADLVQLGALLPSIVEHSTMTNGMP